MAQTTVLQPLARSLPLQSTHFLTGSRICHQPKQLAEQRRVFAPATRSALQSGADKQPAEGRLLKGLQQAATSLAAAAAIVAATSSFPGQISPAVAAQDLNPAVSDLSVLISGPPIKDARALLRNALPIQNKDIKDLAQSLEIITEYLKDSRNGYDRVPGALRQASRSLNQGRTAMLKEIAPGKQKEGAELLDKLSQELADFQTVAETRNKAAIAAKQKETLIVVGDIEECMVDGFPFEIPKEFEGKPWLKGRATVEMKVRVKDNPNLDKVTLTAVIDGYNAPITAGNFIDLVERRFYNGMDIQRADGFVVQTGDPEGPAEGFVDPNTGSTRTIPLEIMVIGDKEPTYHETLEEQGRYKAQTRLPFNAFGTIAMARDEFDNDSASSQVFWLLKESELTPSQANILDGRYAVFGYVVDNEDFLADFKVGDTIESIKVIQGGDNLQNPSFK